MERLTDRIQHFFETYAFGVCTPLGEILGVATSSIRLFFIYASFIAFGSPVLIYLSLGIYHEHAEASAQAESDLGLLE